MRFLGDVSSMLRPGMCTDFTEQQIRRQRAVKSARTKIKPRHYVRLLEILNPLT